MAREVASIAEELGRSSAQVALNWVFQKPGVTSALFGCRKPEQLHDVLAALDFTLGEDAMGRLDGLSKVDLGFPQRWGDGDFFVCRGQSIQKRLGNPGAVGRGTMSTRPGMAVGAARW